MSWGVFAAVALASLLAAPVFAQQSDAVSVIEKAPFMEAFKGGVKILLALIGFASMTAIALLSAYGLIMYVLGPTHWYRWSALISVVENFKWMIIGVAAFPFALAAAVYGINVVLQGYNAGSLGVKPEEVAVALLKAIYVDPFLEAFQWLFK